MSRTAPPIGNCQCPDCVTARAALPQPRRWLRGLAVLAAVLAYLAVLAAIPFLVLAFRS